MEFRIQKAEFLRGLRLAQSIADRKSTMPMLANVLLRTSGKDKLLVAATDLNVSVSAELASTNTQRGRSHRRRQGAPRHRRQHARRRDHVQARRQQLGRDHAPARSTTAWSACPTATSPRCPTTAKPSYADVDAARAARDDRQDAVLGLATTRPASTSTASLRVRRRTARMVSTDGHRLSKVERDARPGARSCPPASSSPRRACVEIKRILDAAERQMPARHQDALHFLTAGNITLAVKLIDSQFPPYEQVIPKNTSAWRGRPRASSRRAEARAADVVGDPRRQVRAGAGRAAHRQRQPRLGRGPRGARRRLRRRRPSIGFNPKYVVELLDQMAKTQVALELYGELDPGLVRPVDGDDYLGVVMPMRI